MPLYRIAGGSLLSSCTVSSGLPPSPDSSGSSGSPHSTPATSASSPTVEPLPSCDNPKCPALTEQEEEETIEVLEVGGSTPAAGEDAAGGPATPTSAGSEGRGTHHLAKSSVAAANINNSPTAADHLRRHLEEAVRLSKVRAPTTDLCLPPLFSSSSSSELSDLAAFTAQISSPSAVRTAGAASTDDRPVKTQSSPPYLADDLNYDISSSSTHYSSQPILPILPSFIYPTLQHNAVNRQSTLDRRGHGSSQQHLPPFYSRGIPAAFSSVKMPQRSGQMPARGEELRQEERSVGSNRGDFEEVVSTLVGVGDEEEAAERARIVAENGGVCGWAAAAVPQDAAGGGGMSSRHMMVGPTAAVYDGAAVRTAYPPQHVNMEADRYRFDQSATPPHHLQPLADFRQQQQRTTFGGPPPLLPQLVRPHFPISSSRQQPPPPYHHRQLHHVERTPHAAMWGGGGWAERAAMWPGGGGWAGRRRPTVESSRVLDASTFGGGGVGSSCSSKDAEGLLKVGELKTASREGLRWRKWPRHSFLYCTACKSKVELGREGDRGAVMEYCVDSTEGMVSGQMDELAAKIVVGPEDARRLAKERLKENIVGQRPGEQEQLEEEHEEVLCCEGGSGEQVLPPHMMSSHDRLQRLQSLEETADDPRLCARMGLIARQARERGEGRLPGAVEEGIGLEADRRMEERGGEEDWRCLKRPGGSGDERLMLKEKGRQMVTRRQNRLAAGTEVIDGGEKKKARIDGRGGGKEMERRDFEREGKQQQNTPPMSPYPGHIYSRNGVSGVRTPIEQQDAAKLETMVLRGGEDVTSVPSIGGSRDRSAELARASGVTGIRTTCEGYDESIDGQATEHRRGSNASRVVRRDTVSKTMATAAETTAMVVDQTPLPVPVLFERVGGTSAFYSQDIQTTTVYNQEGGMNELYPPCTYSQGAEGTTMAERLLRRAQVVSSNSRATTTAEQQMYRGGGGAEPVDLDLWTTAESGGAGGERKGRGGKRRRPRGSDETAAPPAEAESGGTPPLHPTDEEEDGSLDDVPAELGRNITLYKVRTGGRVYRYWQAFFYEDCRRKESRRTKNFPIDKLGSTEAKRQAVEYLRSLKTKSLSVPPQPVRRTGGGGGGRVALAPVGVNKAVIVPGPTKAPVGVNKVAAPTKAAEEAAGMLRRMIGEMSAGGGRGENVVGGGQAEGDPAPATTIPPPPLPSASALIVKDEVATAHDELLPSSGAVTTTTACGVVGVEAAAMGTGVA
eukprot:GHVS01004716.1.p1 GENE.GHVS01004716.1~~GHVS01004716.1.p1  ORF type:complete len:1244 (-),score=384.07 GHVS01004716.1:3634-7365(-)